MGKALDRIRILARAPSNIALVKYMGKVDAQKNLPANPSLSLTLTKLCTFVEVTSRDGAALPTVLSEGKPTGATGESPALEAAGAQKFLAHFERCRSRAPAVLATAGLAFRDPGGAEIRSANTFPQAAGIASSASSFAALTTAAFAYFSADPQAFRAFLSRADESGATFREALARVSREGSGSSCRSFGGPFVSWENETVTPLASNLPPLSDLVVVVASGKKEVGSSEAHRRVRSSPHWSGRVARAEARYQLLFPAIARGDFSAFAELARADSDDMHALFESSVPSFGYRTPATREVIEFLPQVGSPYAVTLDAGPNVHVIVPQSTEAFWKQRLVERFPQHPLLVDRQGMGAEIMRIEDGAASGGLV